MLRAPNIGRRSVRRDRAALGSPCSRPGREAQPARAGASTLFQIDISSATLHFTCPREDINHKIGNILVSRGEQHICCIECAQLHNSVAQVGRLLIFSP